MCAAVVGYVRLATPPAMEDRGLHDVREIAADVAGRDLTVLLDGGNERSPELGDDCAPGGRVEIAENERGVELRVVEQVPRRFRLPRLPFLPPPPRPDCPLGVQHARLTVRLARPLGDRRVQVNGRPSWVFRPQREMPPAAANLECERAAEVAAIAVARCRGPAGDVRVQWLDASQPVPASESEPLLVAGLDGALVADAGGGVDVRVGDTLISVRRSDIDVPLADLMAAAEAAVTVVRDREPGAGE